MSEKFDGSRALWNGSSFVSRLGETWTPPSGCIDSVVIDKFKGSFTANFPAEISLDGELWGGRGTFDKIGALVRKKETTDDDWKGVVFKGKSSSGLCSKTSTVFDSP